MLLCALGFLHNRINAKTKKRTFKTKYKDSSSEKGDQKSPSLRGRGPVRQLVQWVKVPAAEPEEPGPTRQRGRLSSYEFSSDLCSMGTYGKCKKLY